MTVRRPQAQRNTYSAKFGMPAPAARRALLTLRAAVIISGGLAVGLATGILTYFAAHNPPEAVLASIPACAGAIKFLDTLIG